MAAQVAEVQELIRQVGLAPTKAKNICNMSKVHMSSLLQTVCNIIISFTASPQHGQRWCFHDWDRLLTKVFPSSITFS